MPRFALIVAPEVLADFHTSIPDHMTVAEEWPLSDGTYLEVVDDVNAPDWAQGQLLNPTFQRDTTTGAVTVMSYGQPAPLTKDHS